MRSAAAVFHEGERAVQDRAGEADIAARVGHMVTRVIQPNARAFLANTPTFAIASVDDDNRLAISFVLADRDFATSKDGTGITLALDRAHTALGDPLRSNLQAPRPIGVLAIDLPTRRRFRVNGLIVGTAGERVEIDVTESFPNCPKYIQRRTMDVAKSATEDDSIHSGESLGATQIELISRADTMFVASRHREKGLDASHRGGRRGFVEVRDSKTLVVPDYGGNSMFSTLGNLSVDPSVAIAIIDFERGRVLTMSGKATVRFDLDVLSDEDTGRAWEVRIERFADAPLPELSKWRLVEPSPFNPL